MLRFAHNDGFTLAEVLITLVIIGVIAAITVPTMIANYRKQEYVSGLQKAISALEQGFKLCMASEGVTNLDNCSIIQAVPNEYRSLAEAAKNGADLSEFERAFRKYFNVLKFVPEISQTKYKAIHKGGADQTITYPTVFLNDGSYMAFSVGPTTHPTKEPPTVTKADIKAAGGHLFATNGEFYIDVNGKRPPNQFGRDVYRLILSNNGTIVPHGTKDFAILNAGADYENFAYYYFNPNANDWAKCDPSLESTSGSGWGCATRIISEGWQMNY